MTTWNIGDKAIIVKGKYAGNTGTVKIVKYHKVLIAFEVGAVLIAKNKVRKQHD